MGLETKAPLEGVFASTFLGSEKFIAWAKENLIDKSKSDTRNILVLRQMVDKPSLEEIQQTIESIIGTGHPFGKARSIYMSHQYGGFRLKEIGVYYGMRGSAVSQPSRRFKQKIDRDRELRKTVAEIARQLKVC